MAANTAAEQRKALAKLLYCKEMLPQKEIADKVGVSPVTINRWVKKERWDDLRVSITMTNEEQLKALYTQLKELNEEIANRAERRYATTQESDIISKLSSAIEKMESEVGLSEIISVVSAFLGWIRNLDLSKAQELVPLFDDFIKSRLR